MAQNLDVETSIEFNIRFACEGVECRRSKKKCCKKYKTGKRCKDCPKK